MSEQEFEASQDAQEQLLEDSLPVVFQAYDDARQRRIKDPVVFLLDCEDEIGGQIARSWVGDEAVDDAIAEQQSETSDPSETSRTTVFAVAFPFRQCRSEVPAVFPYLQPAFDESPPAEGFYAISVTAGGASIFTAPLSARPK